jgi:hypothetical protein
MLTKTTRHLRPTLFSIAVALFLGAEPARPAGPASTIPSTVVVITHYGFSHSRVTVRAGKNLLIVINRSGYSQPHLALDRLGADQSSTATRIHDQVLRPDLQALTSVFDLQPGLYKLRDLDHGWECQILVQ